MTEFKLETLQVVLVEFVLVWRRRWKEGQMDRTDLRILEHLLQAAGVDRWERLAERSKFLVKILKDRGRREFLRDDKQPQAPG